MKKTVFFFLRWIMWFACLTALNHIYMMPDSFLRVVLVCGAVVTHWMPLPDPPEAA